MKEVYFLIWKVACESQGKEKRLLLYSKQYQKNLLEIIHSDIRIRIDTQEFKMYVYIYSNKKIKTFDLTLNETLLLKQNFFH